MKDTGIWFHPSGILGASAGGIVDHVLEVKCPYTEQNLTIEEAAKSEKFCLEKTESGQYALRKHHFLLASSPRRNVLNTQEVWLFCCMDYKGCSYSKNRKGRKLGGQHPTLNKFYLEHIFPKTVEGKCSAIDLFKIFNLSNGHNSGLFLGGRGAMVI